MSKNCCDTRLRHQAFEDGDLTKAVSDSLAVDSGKAQLSLWPKQGRAGGGLSTCGTCDGPAQCGGRASDISPVARGKRSVLLAAVVLVVAFGLSLTGALAGVGSPLPHPSDPSPDQVARSPRSKLPVCQPTVPADDFPLTIITVDGAVVTQETTIAIKEGFLAAQRRLERPWVISEDFVFIAHPIQITEPQTGFWCGDGVNAWCGGYYEYRPDYQEFGKPEIHFVSDFLNPARVRALIDHEAAHGIAHLAGCPNWYTIGHNGLDVCS